jgi:hypothetical protein
MAAFKDLKTYPHFALIYWQQKQDLCFAIFTNTHLTQGAITLHFTLEIESGLMVKPNFKFIVKQVPSLFSRNNGYKGSVAYCATPFTASFMVLLAASITFFF